MITRREFVRTTAMVGTAAALIGARPGRSAAEPPPETTRLRLLKTPSLCWAPQYIADELLRAEGFTEITHLENPTGGPVSEPLAEGKADMSLNFVAPNIVRVDQGDPVVFLAGIHAGCFEVFGSERIERIRDLKGTTVVVDFLGGAHHTFFSIILAYLGLDPRRDIRWITPEPARVGGDGAPARGALEEALRLFSEGKADGFIGFPPQPQELRARKIGRVLVNSATDRPWSQYFCCLLTASKEFVRAYPVATKRALRAILKATDLCASDPERAARTLVDKGYAPRYDLALQVMRELPYNRWREYDVEDTLRFYALRLHEVGMIKASPQTILAQSTDWRFVTELKRELKG